MNYTELEIWKESRKLVNMIYTFTNDFPKEEVFGLTNQMRRSSISIPSNIAEGCGRNTINDTLRFLYISRGSLFELETQVFLAKDQDYFEQENSTELFNQVTICKKLLNGFINYHQNLKDKK